MIIALVGPTAAGKSALAMGLADALGAEIVNADSMQGYRGMDIGTAKPTHADRRRVPHHVLDIWPASHEISVVEFQQAARAAILDVQGRHRVPLVVGGSWLYVQAIVDHLEFPPTDPEVRARWQEALDREGSAALHAHLAERDPTAAAAIEVGNGRRIVRALEVIELTGGFTARMPEPVSWQPTLWLGVDRDRTVLDARIADRVHHMWDAGLVEEVRTLRRQGMGATASKAVGYSQAMAVLDGRLTESEAIADVIGATRRLARRQQRRFRADARVHWCVSGEGDGDIAQIAELVAQSTAT